MFFYTDTADAPWTVVKSNDKKRARLEAMRHVLNRFDYDDKDVEVVGTPDPLIVGPAALAVGGHRDVAARVFPPLCDLKTVVVTHPPMVNVGRTREGRWSEVV